MVGDIKSERWARSFRNGGRHQAESALNAMIASFHGDEAPLAALIQALIEDQPD
jgi:hypothetical protein